MVFKRSMPPPPPAQHDSLEKFLTFQREVNRLFRRIFEEGTAGRSLPGEAVQARANVSEAGNELRVEVETPGTPADRLSLWVSRDLIVVEGEKPARSRAVPGAARDGRVTYHCMERDFGAFRRVLEIPCPVDTNGIRATYGEGLLTIVLPKIEDRRGERRKVEIHVERKHAHGKGAL
jgi:HSP20 family protein